MKDSSEEVVETEEKSPLHKVTPVSKYLAMILFIILPFLGGWIGYSNAPEKIIPMESVVVKEVEKVSTEYVVSTNHPSYLGLMPVFHSDFYSNFYGDDIDKHSYGISGEKYFWGSEKEDAGQVLYWLSPMPMTSGVILQSHEGVDAVSFEVIDNDFAKDKNFVYYFGLHLGPDIKPGIVEGADPNTFEPQKLFGMTHSNFGVDKDFVYFLTKKLPGLNPDTATRIEKGILMDGDTYWFPSGNCHYSNYRLGTAEEVEEFIPPC